jgi:hypothetical protein
MGFRQGLKPSLLEGNAGQVHPAGAAHLFLAVYMIDVSAGILLYALVGQLEQVLRRPKVMASTGQISAHPGSLPFLTRARSRRCTSSPAA